MNVFKIFSFFLWKIYYKVGPSNIVLLIVIPQEVVERRNIFQSYRRSKTRNISFKLQHCCHTDKYHPDSCGFAEIFYLSHHHSHDSIGCITTNVICGILWKFKLVLVGSHIEDCLSLDWLLKCPQTNNLSFGITIYFF